MEGTVCKYVYIKHTVTVNKSWWQITKIRPLC